MTWRITFVYIFLIFLLSTKTSAQAMPPGFARNPYGVAGSPKSLIILKMPSTSPLYDWIPHEKARYITVRPYSPPRGGIAADDSTNPYFWNLSSGMIGRSDADRTKFRAFVLRNKGAIWIIGNEPDSISQDNLTPTEYVYMYNTYFTQVRSIDPTAKFAIASITGGVHHKEIGHITAYYDQVFSEYQRIYSKPMSFDYWNLHAYYHGWAATHPKTNPEMANLVFSKIIDPYLLYRKNASGGKYATKPILATEIGIAAPELNLSQAAVIEYMTLFTDRLLPLVHQGIIEHFFWFYGGWAGSESNDAFTNGSLLDNTWKKPTALGIAYAQKARAWDREHGVERADFTRDAKINIFDVNRLVKGFGTTDAALSLDTNPKVTTNDLTLFKQVWNFLK